MLVAPPGGEPVLLDFLVEAPGRGADRRRARRWSPSMSRLRRRRPGVPHRRRVGAASYGTPGGDLRGGRAVRDACRWPTSPRPRSRSPATASRSTASRRYVFEMLAPIASATPESARAASCPTAGAARRATRCATRSSPTRIERLGAEGAGAVLHGRHRRRGLATGCSSAAARSTRADLAALRADRRASRCASRYRGREVLTNPPPSAGGIADRLRARAARARGRRRRTRWRWCDGDGGARRPSARRSSSTGLHEPGFLARVHGQPARLDDARLGARRRRLGVRGDVHQRRGLRASSSRAPASTSTT